MAETIKIEEQIREDLRNSTLEELQELENIALKQFKEGNNRDPDQRIIDRILREELERRLI